MMKRKDAQSIVSFCREILMNRREHSKGSKAEINGEKKKLDIYRVN